MIRWLPRLACLLTYIMYILVVCELLESKASSCKGVFNKVYTQGTEYLPEYDVA